MATVEHEEHHSITGRRDLSQRTHEGGRIGYLDYFRPSVRSDPALPGFRSEQLRFAAHGLALTLPGDDRTDRPPRILVVPRGERDRAFPVQAPRDWLQASGRMALR